MNKKGLLLGFAVCLAAVAYGGTDSENRHRDIKDENGYWKDHDNRSLSLPFSIQAEGDVLLLASDKEAD